MATAKKEKENKNNNEGRLQLDLPSGRKAVLRPYDAYVADALGDVALQEEGTAYDKAICGLAESIDGQPMPSFEEDRIKAINTARELLLNDYHHIIFMAAASYRDGFFEGDVPDIQEGGMFPGFLQLLEEDGSPLERFEPPSYPLGTDKKHEWEETVTVKGGDTPEIKPVKFKLTLLDGHARARMIDSGARNFNADLVSRNPAWYDDKKGMWIKYQPKAHPPSWVAKILSTKAKEIDPVIQYSGKFKNRGRTVEVSLFGIPDFFLRDFT